MLLLLLLPLSENLEEIREDSLSYLKIKVKSSKYTNIPKPVNDEEVLFQRELLNT